MFLRAECLFSILYLSVSLFYIPLSEKLYSLNTLETIRFCLVIFVCFYLTSLFPLKFLCVHSRLLVFYNPRFPPVFNTFDSPFFRMLACVLFYDIYVFFSYSVSVLIRGPYSTSTTYVFFLF